MITIYPKPGSVFARLALKIKKDTGINLVNFKRLYCDSLEKSAGGWAWVAYILQDNKLSKNECGSVFSATDLLKAKKLTVSRDEYGQQPEILPN